MRTMLVCLLALLATTVCGSPAGAADVAVRQQTELLEKIERLQKQIAELKTLKQQKQALPVKRDQCMKAVGVESYCSCVVEKLPAMIDFKQFVHILLTPALELGYDKMAADQKKDVDASLVVWAKCVDYKGPKGSGLFDNIMNRETLF